jgi:hypothetical protein
LTVEYARKSIKNLTELNYGGLKARYRGEEPILFMESWDGWMDDGMDINIFRAGSDKLLIFLLGHQSGNLL